MVQARQAGSPAASGGQRSSIETSNIRSTAGQNSAPGPGDGPAPGRSTGQRWRDVAWRKKLVAAGWNDRLPPTALVYASRLGSGVTPTPQPALKRITQAHSQPSGSRKRGQAAFAAPARDAESCRTLWPAAPAAPRPRNRPAAI